MAALADPIRCRMLLPLERHELTVKRDLLGPAAAAVDRVASPQDARRWRVGVVARATARAGFTAWRCRSSIPARSGCGR
jgi:hypothetical protein